MKPSSLRCLFLVLLVGLLMNAFLWAGNKTIHDVKKMDTPRLVANLNSGEWRERSLSVEVVKARWIEINAKNNMASKEELAEKDQIALGLIKLLEKTDAEEEKWWEDYAKTEYKVRPPSPDPCEDCYLQLVDAVMLLKDRRALNALIDAIDNGKDMLNEVVGFGKEAVLPLIEKVGKTKNSGLKSASLRALGKISQRHDIEPDSKMKIKSMLKDGLNDPEWIVRLGAVEGAGEFDDPELIPLVEETIKKEDLNPKTKNMKRNPVKMNGEKTLKKLRIKQRAIEEAAKK